MSGPLTMVLEFGIYVDGQWYQWLPQTRVEQHGWKSAADAVAYWKHPDRAHQFVPHLNGRETRWGQNTGGVLVNSEYRAGQIAQRAWFEGEPQVSQLEFDLSGVA